MKIYKQIYIIKTKRNKKKNVNGWALLKMQRTSAMTPSYARKRVRARMDQVMDIVRKKQLKITFKQRKMIKNNFYNFEMFGEPLLPLKNIIYDLKNGTKTSLVSSEYSSLEQQKNTKKINVNWLPTLEPFANIDYSNYETFEDFKKVFSVITDENELKKEFDKQKKKDQEYQYKPIHIE